MSGCAPLPLNSCTVTWRDPAATSPVGRLQADIRLYPLGGLTEFCESNDCDDIGRGLGICLHDVDQTIASDPPVCDVPNVAGYENPLRVTGDGCVWVRWQRPAEKTCTVAEAQQVLADGSLPGVAPVNGPVTHTVTNPTCETVTVRRSVTVIGAGVTNPPPVEVTDNTVDPPVTEITPAQAVYQITVDGQTVPIVGACSGGCNVASTTVQLDDVTLEPGAGLDIVAVPELDMISPAGPAAFPVSRGQITVCAEMVWPLTEETAVS